MTPRVLFSPTALEVIERVKKKYGNALLFHQSGGCCDGSAPMLFLASEFMVGPDTDVKLGQTGDIPFYMTKSQFEYWKHTQLTIDAIPGNGGMFSLEGATGMRFITRSRVYTDEEMEHLEPLATT